MKTLHFLILLALWPGVLPAHEDTLIRLEGTTLVGLPKEYAPAQLDLKVHRLRIGKHAMTFSPLLQSLFEQPHDLRLGASWYHEKSLLPPYLLLLIQPKKKDFSYDILFNLETLEVIKLSVSLRESESTTRQLEISLSDQWKEDIRKSIQTLE